MIEKKIQHDPIEFNLEDILYPNKLKGISHFQRYVLFLIASYGLYATAKQLDWTVMRTWRFLKKAEPLVVTVNVR